MKKMGKEFKEFLIRGDALNLAVGVVIGGAFTAIVNSLVTALITPLIELFISLFVQRGDKLDEALDILNVTVNGVTFNFSLVISAIITFIITGFVLFLIVKAANHTKDSLAKKEAQTAIASDPTAEDYLKEIRDLLQAQATKEADKK